MKNPWFDTLPGPRLAQILEEKGDFLRERHHTDDVHFAFWLHVLDANVRRRVLVSYDDLEDWDYWSNYDAGMTPREAAIEMLADNGYADAYDEALS